MVNIKITNENHEDIIQRHLNMIWAKKNLNFNIPSTSKLKIKFDIKSCQSPLI